MKEIKSYTSIWNVEKIIYSLMNINLPIPLTFTQIAWFMGVLFADIIFRNIPPLAWTDNVLLKYIAIPAGLTWLMSQKTFDGKKPYSFLRSVIAYYIHPKVTYAGKTIRNGVIYIFVKHHHFYICALIDWNHGVITDTVFNILISACHQFFNIYDAGTGK